MRKTREERERDQFLANRRGRGRKRVQIQRSFAPTDGQRSVRGNGIIIRPQTFNRDSFRALIHFAKARRISLHKLEVITAEERGVSHETVITWLAIGEVEALRELANHSYIGIGNWHFATDAQVIGSTKLAREPKKESEPAYPCPRKVGLEEAGII